MPHFEQEIFYKSISTLDKDEEYLKALKMVAKVRNEFDELLKDNDLDSFVGLTRNPAWQIDYEGGDDAAMANQVELWKWSLCCNCWAILISQYR